MLSRWQFYDKLFDKRAYIFIRYHRALPLFDAQHTLGYFDLEIALHLALAPQSPVIFDLFPSEMRPLRVENLSATFQYLHFALPTTGFAAARRRKKDSILVQRGHQIISLPND